MKLTTAIIAGFVLLAAPAASADALDLGGYQSMDGAITVGNGGDMVEPYFANKALLLAKEGGLNIDSAANDWIKFALSKQRADGLFERYCHDKAALVWNACGATDADDAALALWLELLHIMKPASEWPAEWKASAEKAEAQLASLQMGITGLYVISASNPVSLLMDNVEIYYAFKTIAKSAASHGDVVRATEYRKKARAMAKSIKNKFWNADNGVWEISTQPRTETEFYPDIVAQIYPLFYDLPVPNRMNPRTKFMGWMGVNRDLWMQSVHEDFPWGLVAVAAIKADDVSSANCWQEKVEPFRYSNKWNVLEEAAFQRVQRSLGHSVYAKQIPCVEGTV